MQIKKIKIRNFYSFEEAELELDSLKGIVEIVGINHDSGASNGSGKSSIIEAIIYGITGKTLRKSTEDALVNNKAGENCLVEIDLYKESIGNINIKRTRKPSALVFTVNGINANKENATETQKYIDEVLDTDYKALVSSSVFGQHSEQNFLESSPEDKRNIIRNCFNLDDLFSKRNYIKELKSSYTSTSKLLERSIESIRKEIKDTESKVPNSKYKYVELPPLESILKVESEILSHKNEIAKHKTSLTKLNKSLKGIQDSINKGEFQEESECPICKSKYTVCQDSYSILDLNVQKSILESNIRELTSTIEEIQSEIDKLTPKYSSIEWAKYNEKNKLINEAQIFIDRVAELKEKLSSTEKEYNDGLNIIEVMKFWEKAFSEQGMIKYIIRNILDYFNLKANEYLSILTNNQFHIIFSDNLSEEIFNNGINVKYISLSGGEKKKTNLAIMLALQDLQNKVSRTNTNLIFFDEVCDNIDDSGIAAIYNLLNALKEQHKNKVLFVITHNNTLRDLLTESPKITVEKRKGISRIKSYGN